MKNIIKYSVATLVSIVICASCINDLDTLPLNPSDNTSENAYKDKESYQKGMAYVYGYFALVSQNDPGSNDLSMSVTAGETELVRQYWALNEISTDEVKCAWSDAYVGGLQFNKWTSSDNAGVISVYRRCLKAITLCNEFFIQTADAKLATRGHSDYAEQVHGFRAEVRFLRALNYYILLDMFGNPPFAVESNIGGDLPIQISRSDLYSWLESELMALTEDADMPDYGEVAYPRATKGAVWAVLARMYLNAEVYTGTAQWEKARAAATKVIAMGYKLHTTQRGTGHDFGAYAELFMQDNTTNGAADEFIYAVAYDRSTMQSWGGTTHLISGGQSAASGKNLSLAMGYNETVYLDPWNGYHVSTEFVHNFIDPGNISWGESGFGYDLKKNDKRAFFFNGARKETFEATDFETGWVCWKFKPINSDGTYATDATSTHYKLSSADFPIFRLAEIYLIYAEAQARIDGGTTTDAIALGYIKSLRDRAGVSMPSSISTDFILSERTRELMWEGHRRTDLIRYGLFTSASFSWPYKGGVADGRVAIESYRTIYPLIQSDLNTNFNLKQNFGY